MVLDNVESAVPVHDGHQIGKTARKRNVGDVGRPDLIDMGDRDISKQVWVGLVVDV